MTLARYWYRDTTKARGIEGGTAPARRSPTRQGTVRQVQKLLCCLRATGTFAVCPQRSSGTVPQVVGAWSWLRRKTPTTSSGRFCEHWVNVFGAPEAVYADIENGLEKSLTKIGDWRSRKQFSPPGSVTRYLSDKGILRNFPRNPKCGALC